MTRNKEKKSKSLLLISWSPTTKYLDTKWCLSYPSLVAKLHDRLEKKYLNSPSLKKLNFFLIYWTKCWNV